MDFILEMYAQNANMQILSVFKHDKKTLTFFVHTQKLTKTDENMHCVFLFLKVQNKDDHTYKKEKSLIQLRCKSNFFFL